MLKRKNPRKSPLDLDVDSPEDVVEVLRAAASEYYDSAVELEAAWQSGRSPWNKVAKILESAAIKIEDSL